MKCKECGKTLISGGLKWMGGEGKKKDPMFYSTISITSDELLVLESNQFC